MNNENIVKLVDYVESPGSCYVVMEYCDGGDLESNILKQFIIWIYRIIKENQ